MARPPRRREQASAAEHPRGSAPPETEHLPRQCTFLICELFHTRYLGAMTVRTTTAPGPVSRAEETRQRFVDAAVALFREHGYGATSMSQVAAAAGSSRANLYLYFHSKSEIVLEWMLALRPELDQVYLQLDQLTDHSPAACRAWLSRVVTVWRSHPAEFDAMEQAMSEDSDVHRSRLQMCRQTAAAFNSLLTTADGLQFPPAQFKARQTHMVCLMLGTERCLSSVVLHDAVAEEELFLDALAHQWSALLTARPCAERSNEPPSETVAAP